MKINKSNGTSVAFKLLLHCKDFMKRTETIELEQGLEKLAKEKRWYGCEEITIGFYGNGHGNEICDYILMDSKGIIRCYELKVTKQDLKSHAKKSWYGNYNYLVVTNELYEKIISQGESWNDYLPDGVGLMVGYKSYEYIQDEMDTEILDIFDFNEKINYKKRNSKKVIRFHTEVKPIKKELPEKEQLMLTQSMIRSMNYKIIKYKDANNLDNLNKAKKTALRYERLYNDKVKENNKICTAVMTVENELEKRSCIGSVRMQDIAEMLRLAKRRKKKCE